MKYYLIAGEASGDLHGSNLMAEIKELDSSAEFRFWGGDLMSATGGELVRHYKETAIMGFVEVIASLGKISKNLKDCKEDLVKYKPDVLILIDYPGFNLRIAKFAKKNKIKVFYYISPKVWAWKESRIKLLQKYIDQLFIIFPFEVDYFKKWGIKAEYYGNPLVDKIDKIIENKDKPEIHERRKKFFLQKNNLSEKPIIALLVGSRKMEIKFLLPHLISVVNHFSNQYQFILAAAPSIDESFYKSLIPEGTNIRIVYNDTYNCLLHSQASVISSGTASLEAALIGTPQVVCYGVNPISYLLAKAVVKIKFISLGNLIINRLAFKELIQGQVNPPNIISELNSLLNDQDYRKKMFADYDEIRRSLGDTGVSRRIAQGMINKI